MTKTISGVLVGLVLAGCALFISWSFGWVHVSGVPAPGGGQAMENEMGTTPGAMAEPENAAPVDEHAGHDMGAVGTEPMTDEGEMETMDTVPPAAADPAMPEGAVMISPERQQLIGVRTAVAVREPASRTIRTVGRVEYDERLVAHIHTKVEGWIETLAVDFTGEFVAAGQPLLEIYSPSLVATQEEYLLALRARAMMQDSSIAEVAAGSRSLLDATRNRLLLWDITAEQIEQLEERGTPTRTLSLHSPIEGYVIHKGAYEGQFVGPKDELFAIADLTQVWVTADIYESELPLIQPGQSARVTLSYQPGQVFRGRVDYIYPYLAGETRTAKVRIELPNPDAAFKPDMYANVEIDARRGTALTVPEDAVIDSGARQVVLLALEEGHFLPREVQVGARLGDRLEILSGLEEGDVVVSGAAFLIDSESKLRSALRGMTGHQH